MIDRSRERAKICRGDGILSWVGHSFELTLCGVSFIVFDVLGIDSNCRIEEKDKGY